MNADPAGLDQKGHPSRLSMARLLAGDIDEIDSAALLDHIRACPACGGIFSRAESAAADFASRHPTLESLERAKRVPLPSRRKAEGWPARLREFFFPGAMARPAFAGVLLLAAAAMIWWPREDLTAKGSPRFAAYLNGLPVQGDTLACAPGDTLQLAIIAPAQVHYAVLYRDDAGPLGVYLAANAHALGSPKGELLPRSLVLGKGWMRETLFCVWSSHAFTPAEAEAAAEGKPAAQGLHMRTIPLANREP